MSIKPIKAPRLYQRIADELARLIDAGTFRPGERLPAERTLAQQMGVSRSSLREALSALELAGRVDIRLGSGVYVRVTRRRTRPAVATTDISPFDILRARRLVESEAAALAARHATPKQVAALRAAFARLADEMRADRPMSRADREFHRRIAEASGNSALAMIVERLWSEYSHPLNARIEELFVTRGRKRDNIGEHRAVLDAIARGDSAGARRAMRRHLANAERQRMALLKTS